MTILGVDPGLQNTGFAVLQAVEKSCRILQFGLIKTNNSQLFEQRLKTIYDQLCEIIEKYQFEVVALEEIFYSRNVKVALKMSHARGVTLLAAANYQITTAEYSPREIKQAVTGNGNASKYQVQQMICRLLNLPSTPSTYDITDAMAVAYCCSQRVISEAQFRTQKK
jgi:crossover junction endodeoxyribonuclease RuvC